MAGRPREDEDGSEGHFASVSDLMVGILFIFLLMLTVFALNFADDDKDAIIHQLTSERDTARAELRDAKVVVERQKSENEALTHRVVLLQTELKELAEKISEIEASVSSESRRPQNLRQKLLLQIQASLAARKIGVEISEQQDVLRLPSEEIFQSGTAEFTPHGREQVTALLEEMTRVLPCYAVATSQPMGCKTEESIFETVLIEGHTDTVRFDNWRLSTARAQAVLGVMVGPLGSLTELRNASGQTLLGLAGYGESRPLPQIAGNDPRNRRIEVRFLLSVSREAELATLHADLKRLRQRIEALSEP
jgi:chemotaxis protein MotB